MNGPTPAPAEVMDRLAYWHDLRAELPDEAVDAARSYLLGFLAAEVDSSTWSQAVDQAVELARAESESGQGWDASALAAAALTGAGALGLVELVTRLLAGSAGLGVIA